MSAEDQIRQYAERIVRLEEERRALAEDIKECKAEAKAAGFSPKLIATCVRIMLMEAEKRAEALSGHEELDLYLGAVGLIARRDGDEIRGTRPAVPGVATVPAAPFGKGSATLEHGHVDRSASALPRQAYRRDEVKAIEPGAAEPLADDPSSALFDGATHCAADWTPSGADTGSDVGTVAQISRDGASGMVGGFPVPATPLSRGGAGSERTDVQSVTARRDGTHLAVALAPLAVRGSSPSPATGREQGRRLHSGSVR